MKAALTTLALLGALGCQGNSTAATPSSKANDETVGQTADNTERNVRDRDPMAVTSGDQSESEADRKISQQARQGVVAHDDLSMSAKNVKIITADGVVTLRGPVTTAHEKAEIVSIVKQVDGVKRIDNQLEIAAK